MKYMLDTNICIFIMKHKSNVLSAFELNRKEGVAISAITLAELQYGVCKSDFYEKSSDKLTSFLSLVEILPFDDTAAMVYGKICAFLSKQGKRIGNMDMLIAAHAKAEGLVVVTNNTSEFERIPGLELEDWLG